MIAVVVSDAAFEFIEKRKQEALLLLQRAAAGVDATELLLQRRKAAADLLRPLALQQQRLEQVQHSSRLQRGID